MHDDDSQRDGLTPAEQDRAFQHEVLHLVLAKHPDRLTVPELVLEITAGTTDPETGGDGVERAVRDLTGAGLLRYPGGTVEPTHAALCFEEVVDSAI